FSQIFKVPREIFCPTLQYYIACSNIYQYKCIDCKPFAEDSPYQITDDHKIKFKLFMPRNISAEIETLRQKLAKLESRQLSELRAKRREAQKVVDDLDARIAKITGKSPTVGRRKRTSPPEVRERIFKALEKNPKGLSQKEI